MNDQIDEEDLVIKLQSSAHTGRSGHTGFGGSERKSTYSKHSRVISEKKSEKMLVAVSSHVSLAANQAKIALLK